VTTFPPPVQRTSHHVNSKYHSSTRPNMYLLELCLLKKDVGAHKKQRSTFVKVSVYSGVRLYVCPCLTIE
jgi:hypothetical protein